MEKIKTVDLAAQALKDGVDPWAGSKENVRLALEKRPAFLASVASATTFADLRAAVEAYAIDDANEPGQKIVTNFLEGAYADQNEEDGEDTLKKVLEGLSNLETNGATTHREVYGQFFNYVLANKVCELLNIKESEDPTLD